MVPSNGINAELSAESFHKLRDFIYERSGLFFSDMKKSFLESRLRDRLAAKNLSSFDAYTDLLTSPSGSMELRSLYDAVTIGETSFFRCPPQFEAFGKRVLPEVLGRLKEEGTRRLRIWSAGCSNGEEPYSLAMVTQETLGDSVREWTINIAATDISEEALAVARKNVYPEYALRSAPPLYRDKYFKKTDNDFSVNDPVKRMIMLKPLNLAEKIKVNMMKGVDIIFCRNVLLYFKDDFRKVLVQQLYDVLRPGGYLFIGHTESLHSISKAFKLVHFTGAMAYKKA